MAGPWYIDFADGNNANTGLSEDQAWKTLSHISGQIVSNDQVYVRSGLSSTESPLLTGFSGVKIRSIDFGSGSTALSNDNFTITDSVGNARDSVFSHSCTNRIVVLEGMTIDAQDSVEYCINMYEIPGAGGLAGKLEMNRCILKSATKYGARARGQSFSSQNGIVAVDCTVHDCQTTGLDINASNTANAVLTVTDSTIYSCGQGLASRNGGGQITVSETLVYDCSVGIYLDGKSVTDTPVVDQCTIDDCVVGINASPSDSSQSTITNTTISNCTFSFDVENTSSAMFYSYTNFYEAPLPQKPYFFNLGNSLGVDPQFNDELDRDYTLTVPSQLIGAGDPDTSPPDADGRHPIDIGAFQFDLTEALMAYDYGTEQLVYLLKLRLGDTAGDAFDDKVCLALLNEASDWYFNTHPTEAVNCGLSEYNYRVSITSSGGLYGGTLSPDILMVKNARQVDSPSREAEVVDIQQFMSRRSSSMRKGTYYLPLVGIDLNGRKIFLDAENYTSDIYVDYIRKPLKLKISGVEDEYGVDYTSTVDPEWPTEHSLPILDKAVELGVLTQNRDVPQGTAKEGALETLRRMSNG